MYGWTHLVVAVMYDWDDLWRRRGSMVRLHRGLCLRELRWRITRAWMTLSELWIEM